MLNNLYNLQGFVKFGEFSKGNFFTWFLPQKLHFPCIYFSTKEQLISPNSYYLSKTVHASTTKYTYSSLPLFTQMMSYYYFAFCSLLFCPHSRSWSSFHNSECKSWFILSCCFCLWVHCITLSGCGLLYWTSKIGLIFCSNKWYWNEN